MDIFEQRHSGRSYDEREVTRDQIQQLIEGTQLAPSCYNDQPWTFIICSKSEDPEAYQKLLSTLAEGNQAWAKNAHVLIAVISGTKFHHNGKPNRWGPYDTGAAGMSMALEAVNLGLMAHQMGGFDEKKLSELFQIPEGHIPQSVMAVGYEAKDATIIPKERNKIAKNFFAGKWGHPF